LKLASLVAEFAELLKGNYWAREGNVADVLSRARRIAAELPGDRRANEFVTVVERVAGIGLPRSGSPERDE
jgi:hypothetical protein